MEARVLRYQHSNKVVEFAKLEMEAVREQVPPITINWHYVLMGSGALVLVAGALARK